MIGISVPGPRALIKDIAAVRSVNEEEGRRGPCRQAARQAGVRHGSRRGRDQSLAGLLARSPSRCTAIPGEGVERWPVGGPRRFEQENATVCAAKRIAPICGPVVPALEARHA
jgi:hypothetical protein